MKINLNPAAWFKHLFCANPPNPRFKEAEDRFLYETDRLKKVRKLLLSVGRLAAEVSRQMNAEGISPTDPTRVLRVSLEDYELAAELGFDRICGLRLLCYTQSENQNEKQSD